MAALFYLYLSRDHKFAAFVLNNWQRVKSAKEFASLCAYSDSSFGKKFRQVFGIPPYEWLNQKRAARIYHDLCQGEKSLKQICDDYRFNSLQHLNYFCHKNYNRSPAAIRQIHNLSPHKE